MKPKNFVSTTFLIALLTVVLFVGVWQIKPAYAATLPFSDGLEGGDTSNFDSVTETGGGDVAVESTVKYAGTYAANCSSTAQDGVGSLNLVVNSKVIVAQAMFNIQSPITTGYCTIMEFSGTNSLAANLKYVEFYGEWRWRIDLGASASWENNFSIGFTMSSANWYQLTMTYNVTGEFFTSYVNDTLLYSWTDLNDTGSITSVKFETYPYGGSGSAINIFDNIECSTTTITSNLVSNAVVFSGYWMTKYQKGVSTDISINWTQDSRAASSLNVSIFSWNSTGPYVNTTLSISGHSAWHNFTKTNNDTAFTVVGIKLYCNNTLNEWTTEEFAFTTMNSTMALHNVNGVLQDETGTKVYLRGVGHIHGWFDDAAGGWISDGGYISESYSNIYDEAAITDNLVAMKAVGADHVRKQIKAFYWDQCNVTEHGIETNVTYVVDRWLTLLEAQGMYGILCLFDIDIVSNLTGIINWWGNVSQTLRQHPNLLIEIRNEPDPTSTAERDAFMQAQQDVITRVRSVGSVSPIILMGSLATLKWYWYWKMDWGLSTYYTFIDPLGDNLVYSGHLYRTYYVTYRSDFWNQTLCYADMDDMSFSSVQQETHRPVFVGEIGVNMWEDNIDINPDSGMTDQTEELTWAENVLSYCNEHDLGYSVWEWMSNGGDQWYLLNDTSFTLSRWGEIFYAAATGDVVLTTVSPINTTYTLSSILVSLSATGGTIDHIWWNCKNGTNWIYGSNQTYTIPTSMTGFVVGTSYTFYAWANNTDGDSAIETVMFTVQIATFEGITTDWGGYWGRWWGYP